MCDLPTGNSDLLSRMLLLAWQTPCFLSLQRTFYLQKPKKQKEKWGGVLKNYIKRIAILYGAALILYSPQIISSCLRASDNGFEVVLRLVKKILFQGPYGPLWFLTALFPAVILTYFSSKYLGAWKTVAISFALYLPSVLDTEYSALFSNCAPMQYYTKFILKIFGSYANGLTFGFFFCAIGMIFAFEFESGDLRKDLLALILSFAALFAEAHIVCKYGWGKDYWALFFLTPVCIYGMRVLLELPKHGAESKLVAKAKSLQKMSVLIFIFHCLFLDGFNLVLGSSAAWWNNYPILRYGLVVIFTMLFSVLIIWLSGYDRLKFLRYLY